MTQQYTGDVDWFRLRGSNSSAAFFMPHIKPGIALLDCGCGPGSITLDFAAALAPGEVTGIDIDPWTIEQARAAAGERGAANVRFEVGDIYKLPFADDSFDAVWTASVMQYMEDPVAAAKEMLRVRKPGGVLGERDRSDEGDIIGNANPRIRQAFKLYHRWQNSLGHYLNYGASSRTTLVSAGFKDVVSSATYESQTGQWTMSGTPNSSAGESRRWACRSALMQTPSSPPWASGRRTRGRTSCMARCEAVGWKAT